MAKRWKARHVPLPILMIWQISQNNQIAGIGSPDWEASSRHHRLNSPPTAKVGWPKVIGASRKTRYEAASKMKKLRKKCQRW